MKKLYCNTKVLLTPDIVLSTKKEDYGVVSRERKGVLLCIRNDAEKSVPDSEWEILKNELDEKNIQYSLTDMH